MEDKRFTGLIDKISTYNDDKLLQLYGQIIEIINTDKTGKSEIAEGYGESYDYALKRAVDGSTDSERRIQRNFALFGQALMDVPSKIKVEQLVKKISNSCAQKNVIRKGEKFYYKYAFIRNLFSLGYSSAFLGDNKSWDMVVHRLAGMIKKDTTYQS